MILANYLLYNINTHIITLAVIPVSDVAAVLHFPSFRVARDIFVLDPVSNNWFGGIRHCGILNSR